jgi:hypothetical protein
LVVCSGCVALTPPPLVARHRATAPLPDGTASLSLVVGAAQNGLDLGYGVELRAAYQASADVAVSVGAGIGTATDVPRSNDKLERMWLAALRPSVELGLADWTSVTLGVGLASLTSTGLVALSIDAGIAVSYSNETLVPYGALQVAVAVPIRKGDPFGGEPTLPRTAVYVGGSLGAVLPLDAHAPSADATFLRDLRSSGKLFMYSAADTYTLAE